MSLDLNIPKKDLAILTLFLAIASLNPAVLRKKLVNCKFIFLAIVSLHSAIARNNCQFFFYYSVEETGFHKNVLTHYINN